MKTYFICDDCGNLINYNFNDFDENLNNICNRVDTCTCGWVITMKNSFPSLSAQDFIISADMLFEKAKEKDKLILKEIQENIFQENYSIEITKLDKYLNRYEEIKSKYMDNIIDNKTDIIVEFENYINKFEKYDIAEVISLNITLFLKNHFRKPYVIMAISVMEQLFNDYFADIVKLNLPPSGAITFLKAYENSGIQSCLNIIDSFLSEGLKNKMDKYVPRFYERWDTYRKLRNDIIHSNSKYITKITIRKLKKFIDDGVYVFAHLKGELYTHK
ncbi:MAG TPA: hypothetical protein GX708_17510 [Gallicola sp.]|nr:hypothetical protein [Gallicola sp.]